jgi:hypothetical protein
MTRLRIALTDDRGDVGVLDADAIDLLQQVRQLDIERADLAKEAAPDGAKSVNGVDIGAILVALGGGRFLIRSLAGLLSDWMRARPNRRLSIEFGGHRFEASGVGRADQRRALELFLEQSSHTNESDEA